MESCHPASNEKFQTTESFEQLYSETYALPCLDSALFHSAGFVTCLFIAQFNIQCPSKQVSGLSISPRTRVQDSYRFVSEEEMPRP